MIKITLYSHGCFIHCGMINELTAVKSFVGQRLVQYDQHFNPQTKRMDREVKAVYSARTSDNSEIRILRKDAPALIKHLENQGFGRFIKITTIDPPEWEPIELVMKPEYQPRNEEQQEAINFLMDPDAVNRTAEAATGFGKTFCGFYVTCQKARRTLFAMKATHIETWVQKIKEYFGDEAMKRVAVLKGRESLLALMQLREEKVFPFDFIFISADTYRNYIAAYEDRENPFDYPVAPQDLMAYFKVGLVVRDEAHEAINALCRQTMYTNVAQIIFLSATLVDDDPFVKSVYDRIFPTSDKWQSQPNKYTIVHSMFYNSDHQANLTGFGPRGYSHIAYEKQLMKHKSLFNQFWQMMADLIGERYVENREEGLKCIVFVATVKMAELMKKKAQKEWPDLTIGCYTSKDSDEELYERDIVFSTPGSAGTGKDIRNLEWIWNTVAINSTKQQRQIMGRGRKVADFDREPHYCMLFNRSVRQHKVYEHRREIDSIGRCKVYKRENLPYVIHGTNSTNRPSDPKPRPYRPRMKESRVPFGGKSFRRFK